MGGSSSSSNSLVAIVEPSNSRSSLFVCFSFYKEEIVEGLWENNRVVRCEVNRLVVEDFERAHHAAGRGRNRRVGGAAVEKTSGSSHRRRRVSERSLKM